MISKECFEYIYSPYSTLSQILIYQEFVHRARGQRMTGISIHYAIKWKNDTKINILGGHVALV